MSSDFFKIYKGMSLNPRSTEPSNPVDGDIYYDSTLNVYRFYENGQWKTLSEGTGDVTRLLAGFSDSIFSNYSASIFSQHTNEDVDASNTTASLTDNTKYNFTNILDKLTTTNLVDSSFKYDPQNITRIKSVFQYDQDKIGTIPFVRASIDGGLTWAESKGIKQGYKTGQIETVNDFTGVSPTGTITFDGTNERIAQSFSFSSDRPQEELHKLSLIYDKTGTPAGRIRAEIALDSSGDPGSVVAASDYINFSDLTTGTSNSLEFLFEENNYLLQPNTTYWIVLSIENTDHYYGDGSNKIDFKVASSGITGDLKTFSSSTWSGALTDDLIYALYTKEVFDSKSDLILADLTFDRLNRQDFLFEYPESQSNGTISINGTVTKIGQSFSLSKAFYANKIDFYGSKTGSPTGTLKLSIYSDASNPSTALKKFETEVNVATIGTSTETISFTLEDGFLLDPDTTYWAVIEEGTNLVVDGSNNISFRKNINSGTFSLGAAASFSGSWTTSPSDDFSFKVYGVYKDDLIIDNFDSDYGSANNSFGGSGYIQANRIQNPYNFTVSSVEFELLRLGSPGGNVRLVVYSDSGGTPNTLLGYSKYKAISDISTSLEVVNFDLNEDLYLNGTTPYWVGLEVDSNYSFSSGVNSLDLRIMTGTAFHDNAGFQVFNSASWASDANKYAVHTIYGEEADLRLELTSKEANKDLLGLSAWYGLDETTSYSEQDLYQVTVSAAQASSQQVGFGSLNVNGVDGELIANIDGHVYLSGIDFIADPTTKIASFFAPNTIAEGDVIRFYPNTQFHGFVSKQSDSPIIRSVDSAATLIATKERNQFVTVDTSGGAFTLTLPSAGEMIGRKITLKKTSTDFNTCTVSGASKDLYSEEDTFTVLSDGTTWQIIESHVRSRYAVVTLSSDVTSDGDISSTTDANFRFDNLITGNSYKIYGQVSIAVNETGFDILVDFNTIHDSTTIDSKRLGNRQTSSSAGDFSRFGLSTGSFEATNTTVTFEASNASSNSNIQGNNSRVLTYAVLEETNDGVDPIDVSGQGVF